MYAVMGASGQVGELVAEEFLNAGIEVCALVRAPRRVRHLREQGAETVVIDARRALTLSAPLTRAKGAFVLVPPCAQEWDPTGGAPEIVLSLVRAICAAHPPVVVALSSIGARLAGGTGIVDVKHLLEDALSDCAPSVTFARSPWFLEDWAGAAWPARRHGVLPSTYAPVERLLPQISTVDVASVCVEALLETVPGTRVLELAGPRDNSPKDVAATLGGRAGPRGGGGDAARPPLGGSLPRARRLEERGTRPHRTVHAVCDGSLTLEGRHAFVRGEVTIAEAFGAHDVVGSPPAGPTGLPR
jgi:NAD(P)H dehydrogenase (quinone)